MLHGFCKEGEEEEEEEEEEEKKSFFKSKFMYVNNVFSMVHELFSYK